MLTMERFPRLIRPRISYFPLFMGKSHKSQQAPPASLECHMDSSPIVLNHNHSGDGSVITGSLLLHITENGIQVENLDAIVRIHATYKKPFKKGCRSCKYQTTELKRCQLVTATTSLDRDTYSYPFSFQIPSYTPPTMDTSIVSIVYKLEAIASIQRQGPKLQPSESLAFSRTIQVARSIPVSSTRAISNRIYQADGIEVSCRFNSIMSPTGKNKAILTMSGLRSCPGNGEDVQFWRVSCIEHACGDGAERSTARKKTKALGESSFYDGWATDDQAGSLSMEFPFSTRTRSMKFTQDTGDCGDTFITHTYQVPSFKTNTQFPSVMASQRRRSTGGKRPRRVYPGHRQFNDYTGRSYDVITAWEYGPNTKIPKLSIQLYRLGQPKSTPFEMGLALLQSDAITGWGNARNWWPRCDVYTGFKNVEECVEHHRQEKSYRRKAVEEMRQKAVVGLSEEDAHEKLVTEIQGYEPLPHIVPSWCESAKFVNSWDTDRYKSWIFVIPEDRHSWEDVIEKGLLQVKFDLDVSPEMFTDSSDDFEESTLGKDGWVDVSKSGIEKCKPVEILHLCASNERKKGDSEEPDPEKTPGSDKRLFDAWFDATMHLRDCTYRAQECEECEENEPHEWCEKERDEHYFDEDGQCIACRRESEYRRRSKRVAARETNIDYTV
ncbi:hypothetical protein FAVG1_09472 [Fusarium avenaceum]|nr:hypothetical protein FAVG1_09472 [Fusarium avenaceum]